MTTLIVTLSVFAAAIVALALLIAVSTWLRARAYRQMHDEEAALGSPIDRRPAVIQRAKKKLAQRWKQRLHLAHH